MDVTEGCLGEWKGLFRAFEWPLQWMVSRGHGLLAWLCPTGHHMQQLCGGLANPCSAGPGKDAGPQ